MTVVPSEPFADWTDVHPEVFGEPHDVPDIEALPAKHRPWARQARIRSQAAILTRIAAAEGPESARAGLLSVAEADGREVFDQVVALLREGVQVRRGHAQAS